MEALTYEEWLPKVSPTFKWHYAHTQYILQQLERVTSGEVARMMLFMPPRHFKTETVTVRYPVYRLENEPTMRVIMAAYNQTLANKFSRKARRIAEVRLNMSSERYAVEDWETVEGGGVRAIGVGAGITGQGGNLIVIDDPVKSREEAESAAYRDRVWEWYTDDLYTRLEPNGAIILIMTRWHEDDLAGRILASDDAPNWEVIKMPALAVAGDPIGRDVGEALCPERYDVATLIHLRDKVQGAYAFEALYQQEPRPAEGAMFKEHWFKTVAAAPANATRVRWWDKAGTEDGGDWTVGLLMARTPQGVFYIEDVVRGQWSAAQRRAVMLETTKADAAKYGNRVQVWIEQEPGSAGKDAASDEVRALAGYPVRTERTTGDKTTRAQPLAAQFEVGNVWLLEAPWNKALKDEYTSFPFGKHDDQVDAGSGALSKLAIPQGGVREGPVVFT